MVPTHIAFRYTRRTLLKDFPGSPVLFMKSKLRRSESVAAVNGWRF
jgi:hypothetical protein